MDAHRGSEAASRSYGSKYSSAPSGWHPGSPNANTSSVVIEGEVKDWCRIASKLPGRTNKDCRKRWHNSVAGGLKKGQWAPSEDALLSRGVDRFGQR